jgi:DNA-binding transcriptional MerR regulator
MLQDFDAAFVRQKQIRHYQAEGFPLHDCQGLFAGRRQGDDIPCRLEQQPQRLPAGVVVINQQDMDMWIVGHERLALLNSDILGGI